jgi:RimJ/RimL family protein N-acetyltransferase
MESYKDFIKTTFDTLKRKDNKLPLVCFPIFDEAKEIIAFLKPITKDFRKVYPGIVPLLGKWRKENPTISDSVFEITDERTATWLDNLIIGRDDRILFFIDDFENNHIGHIAYSSVNYKEESAEIDSVLRGVKGKYNGIMTYAMNTMLQWGINGLQLKKIYLSVSKGNDRAINLYKRCGFEIIREIPLIRRELENEIRWDPSEDENITNAERYAVKMLYVGEQINAK